MKGRLLQMGKEIDRSKDHKKPLTNLELEGLLKRIDDNFEGESKEKLLWQFWEMTHPKGTKHSFDKTMTMCGCGHPRKSHILKNGKFSSYWECQEC
jgi:hypothetical protein